MTLKYASVCDGIGAVHVAWQPLGWHCEWTAEIDAFPAAVVEQRWGFPNRGDMTQFKEWNDGSIDLLVGGTPCQSFSVAGLRKGLHDPRGGLMLTFLEIAQRYRPRWVVWENVPGVLSSNGGRDFGAFLGALGELGYGWAYRVLDAQWFGVAQRRRRVFVVGCLGDERCAAKVLFESESVRRDNPPSRANGQGATYDVAPCIGASGRGFERAGETRGQDPVVAQPYRIANCLTQRMHKGINTTCDEGQTPVVAFHPTQDPISSEDGVVHATRATTVVAFDILGTPATRAAKETDVHVPLRARLPGQSEASTTTVVAFKPGQSEAAGAFFATEGFAPTIQSASNGSTAVPAVAFNAYQRTEHDATWPLGASDGRKVEVGVRDGMAVRRLTPRECERLQGFPDDYTAIEYRKKPAADGPRYKALGNSMAVPVMAWIGKRIAALATEERMPA